MTGNEVAAATAACVHELSQGFLMDQATYVAGIERGFAGLDFYFAGRAGVLGDVSADVVTAALVFFNQEQVRSNWDSCADVMSRAEASALLAECGARWADNHLADDVDWARLAQLAGKVIDSASVAGAPMFAGWRQVPVPADPKQAALHQVNVLRELRMARHAAAVLAGGIDVADAVRHRSPGMLSIFGWEESPVAADVADRWEEAERLTNESTAHDYAVLDRAETADFVRLTGEAMEAVG